jgi:hypothetical protein
MSSHARMFNIASRNVAHTSFKNNSLRLWSMEQALNNSPTWVENQSIFKDLPLYESTELSKENKLTLFQFSMSSYYLNKTENV